MTAVTQSAPRETAVSDGLEAIVASGMRLGTDPKFRAQSDHGAVRQVPTFEAFLRQNGEQAGGAQ